MINNINVVKESYDKNKKRKNNIPSKSVGTVVISDIDAENYKNEILKCFGL